MKYVEETVNTKFLDLQIDNHIHWKNYIEQTNPELSAARHVVRSTVHIRKISTLKSIYCAYFHSVIKYGIILWGNSSNSGKILTLQNAIVIIMAGVQPRTSCRNLLKQSEILPAQCHHIQGDSLARGPKLLSIKNYVNQLTDNELTTGYY